MPHGHQAGDEVLKSFATFLQENVRGDDIACRYGGEEFAVILPGATLERAIERAEQLRLGTARLQSTFHGDPLPPITASFGVALFPRDGTHWDELLRAADRALYRAKDEGRNRVVVAPGAGAGIACA
jgi:diguanylate cyclase (GGDEF)-like protein